MQRCWNDENNDWENDLDAFGLFAAAIIVE